jgi:hypothetical protein
VKPPVTEALCVTTRRVHDGEPARVVSILDAVAHSCTLLYPAHRVSSILRCCRRLKPSWRWKAEGPFSLPWLLLQFQKNRRGSRREADLRGVGPCNHRQWYDFTQNRRRLRFALGAASGC